MPVVIRHLVLAVALSLVILSTSKAVVPYTPVGTVGDLPIVGLGISPPEEVYGKEYSDDFDISPIGPTTDPGQVIAWDGIGGSADAADYSGTRRQVEDIDQDIDALANTRDALFGELLIDSAHLVFSHDDQITGVVPGLGGSTPLTVPSAGPLTLANGVTIGGAGEVSFAEAGRFLSGSPFGVWAEAQQVNAMPEPIDVDGVEVWGPEPEEATGPGAPVIGDADKYSLDTDTVSGVSIWNASGTPYLDHASVIAAVESLLGPVPPNATSTRDETVGRQAVNLDALLVRDLIGDPDVFDIEGLPLSEEPLLDQNGVEIKLLEDSLPSDTVVFSIRQLINPEDPDGYYATGSELFVLDSLGGARFLNHSGNLWDHSFTLSELALSAEGEDLFSVIDINAIEAVGAGLVSPPQPSPAGDFNGDGAVDAADYTVWRDGLGVTFTAADYLIWAANFGATSSPSPTTSVPEPSGALLLTAAGIATGVGVSRARGGSRP